MNRKCWLSLVLCAGLQAQEGVKPRAEAPKEIAPDAVVAVMNGKKVTAEEMRRLVAALPGPVQQAFINDPHQFMKDHAWYLIQADWAMKQGIPEKSPYKENLEFQRTMMLVQAAWNEARNTVMVRLDDQKQHYEKNRDRYREVKAKLIYIPFTSGGEDEAKAKAEKVVTEARGGADFVKLVQQYSQDSASKAQNGDMGLAVRPTTKQVPENMKNAILALKVGQVSDAVRHQNGYYVFRAESAGVLDFEKVKDEIYDELQNIGFEKWKEQTRAASSVQFTNEAFFENAKKQQQKQTQ